MRATNEQEYERLQIEGDSFWSPYKLDVERIIHSKAFRRYTDKTQVVYLVENDHLTHRSLHVQLVSSFARGLSEYLGLNVHLVEAIALGHDVGHPPFGHEGEGYLSELSQEMGLGAFSHAHQSCRLFREIEPLNLTLATQDGFLCHDGGMRGRLCEPLRDKSWKEHFQECKERTIEPEKDFRPKTLEGALVKMCDTISYLGKDIEDAIALGIIERTDLPKTMLGTNNAEILERAGRDLIEQSREQEYIALSEELFAALKTLRAFNFERIYNYSAFKVESSKIRSSYYYLFEKLLEDFEKRGESSHLWSHFLHSRTEQYLKETKSTQKVVDFIAGMTDSYFVSTFQKLIVPQKIHLSQS
ncbi:MAG: putative deoxyguanosinetriphosphate triphosphohydrolase [Chlamydiia bacterium]|nr:putative deoxyguanosinetriphosphate triphosphohydrolase [Chlamydiia bacterium]